MKQHQPPREAKQETQLSITGLDYDGRGVARYDGQVVFVVGALPQERVRVALPQNTKPQKIKRFVEGTLLEVLEASTVRRQPPCEYAEHCGGCGLQHVRDEAQMPLKTEIWLEQLSRIGRVQPETVLPAVEKALWHYRSRARLSVQQGKLGFVERGSHRVVDVARCLVLSERVSKRLPELKALCVPHAVVDLEVNVGERLVQIQVNAKSSLPVEPFLQSALVWTQEDGIAWQFVLAAGKAKRFVPEHAPDHAPELSYALPAFGLEIPFASEDFTQVNPEVNRAMVSLAVEALAAPEGAWVLDAFCGLGNFSFALAKAGAKVLGVEGVQPMVDKASALARRLGLQDQCHFERADLFAPTNAQKKRFAQCDYWLLDPPRAGAQALVELIGAGCRPKRLVYVSCDSGTFARDAGILVGKGYRFKTGRLLNMFPQTSHVESLSVFERG